MFINFCLETLIHFLLVFAIRMNMSAYAYFLLLLFVLFIFIYYYFYYFILFIFSFISAAFILEHEFQTCLSTKAGTQELGV